MTARPAGFVRTAKGIKIILPRSTALLNHKEVDALLAFLASGDEASSPVLQRNQERFAGVLRSMTTAELAAELERRGVLEPDDELVAEESGGTNDPA